MSPLVASDPAVTRPAELERMSSWPGSWGPARPRFAPAGRARTGYLRLAGARIPNRRETRSVRVAERGGRDWPLQQGIHVRLQLGKVGGEDRAELQRVDDHLRCRLASRPRRVLILLKRSGEKAVLRRSDAVDENAAT